MGEISSEQPAVASASSISLWVEMHYRVVLLIGLVFVAAALPIHRDSKTVENADERVSLTDETHDLNGGANDASVADASVADASAVDASPVDGEEDVQVEQGVKRRPTRHQHGHARGRGRGPNRPHHGQGMMMPHAESSAAAQASQQLHH